MRQELDDKLCADYPKIFRGRHEPMKETAMCWGFSCGDGWYNIINTMCKLIQSHLDRNPEVPQVVAFQVKEKFAGLRFYYSGGDDYIDGVARMAAALSEVTCEECGAPGVVRGGSWLRCLCDEHSEGRSEYKWENY